jgi:hypothetical protein
MLKYLLIALMVAAPAFGQQKKIEPPAVDYKTLLPPTPTNLHDYAIQQIKTDRAYLKERDKWWPATTITDFCFTTAGKCQSFSIDDDGQYHSDGISEHDAVLALYAQLLEHEVQDANKYDEARKREQAKPAEPKKKTAPTFESVGCVGSGTLSNVNSASLWTNDDQWTPSDCYSWAAAGKSGVCARSGGLTRAIPRSTWTRRMGGRTR